MSFPSSPEAQAGARNARRLLAVLTTHLASSSSSSSSSSRPSSSARAAAAAGSPAPRVVVIFSGKRKSGKDYVCERLQAQLGEVAAIGRLSGPLKQAFAEEHDLDFSELLTDGPYKEKYRGQMIKWGEERRDADPGFFARIVVAEHQARGTQVLM
jgi:hypothetical protein